MSTEAPAGSNHVSLYRQLINSTADSRQIWKAQCVVFVHIAPFLYVERCLRRKTCLYQSPNLLL